MGLGFAQNGVPHVHFPPQSFRETWGPVFPDLLSQLCSHWPSPTPPDLPSLLVVTLPCTQLRGCPSPLLSSHPLSPLLLLILSPSPARPRRCTQLSSHSSCETLGPVAGRGPWSPVSAARLLLSPLPSIFTLTLSFMPLSLGHESPRTGHVVEGTLVLGVRGTSFRTCCFLAIRCWGCSFTLSSSVWKTA